MNNEEIKELDLKIGTLKVYKKAFDITGKLCALSTISSGILYGFFIKPSLNNFLLTLCSAIVMSNNFMCANITEKDIEKTLKLKQSLIERDKK